MPTEQEYNEKTYQELYIKLISLYKKSGAGHIGGGVSILPALYVIFDKFFNEDKDKFILSKGHAVAALYSVLEFYGFISKEEFYTFYTDGTRLPGHPPVNLTSFSPFATGSLGHGPSLAAGLALGKKLNSQEGRVFCVCGDGEWQEGSCWEALMFSVRHQLDNITYLIDFNNWQGFASLADVIALDYEGLGKRLEAFGANVFYCDGCDFSSISNILSSAITKVPSVIMMKTCKGKGIPGVEDTLESHYVQMSDSLYQATLSKMERINEK